LRELLELDGVTVEYRTRDKRAVAVDDVSLRIPENRLTVIVGESGCGKSTLALAIIGLLSFKGKVTAGKIRYRGTDLTQLNEDQRRDFRGTEIAMIFQEPLTSLNPVYKIGDQISEAITVRRKREKGDADAPVLPSAAGQPSKGRSLHTDIRREALEALSLVRMPDPQDVMGRYPFELSGGMRQRAMIAMALSEKPALLIADEPTTALDVTTQAQVLKLMRNLMKSVNASILLITHDLAVASQVADVVGVMYAGDLVEEADVDGLFSDPLHPYTRGLLSCIPSASKDDAELKPIPGQLPDNTSALNACKFVPRCPYAMDACSKKRPRLVEKKPGHRVACFLYGE
jgi:oligopeptide/dipeptide ABC transporter ATP-binding protein